MGIFDGSKLGPGDTSGSKMGFSLDFEKKNMQPHAFIEGFKIFNMGPIFNTGTLGHGKLIASINIFPKEI